MQAGPLKSVSAFLIFLILFPPALIPIHFSEDTNLLSARNNATRDPTGIQDDVRTLNKNPSGPSYSLSDTVGTLQPAAGTMNPVSIEQRGYTETGNVTARTETKTNTNNVLNIDTLHYWVASEANVTVTNLQRIYAVNGTFDEGIPGVNVNPDGTNSYYPLGWTSDSYAPIAGTTQRSAFVQGLNPFVILENEGNLLGTGANTRFQHWSGTRITWFQTIDNRPYKEDFVLTLDFMYINGPIDNSLGNAISLEVWINGTRYWNQSLAQLGGRDVWQSSGPVNINIPGASNVLEFDVRLAINSDLALYPTDYGFIDSNYLTVYVDNIVFTGNTPPEPEQVDLMFNAGGGSELVTGSSGFGTATITNSSYWNTSSLLISFDSNFSISFDYDIRLLNHRFSSSSWTTDTLESGIAYTIDFGKSGTLEMFTYLGTYGVYDDQELIIFHPQDWANFTVQDPFLTDVSSSCTFSSGLLIIPASILDRLGWWKVTCDTPNYASSAEVERYDLGTTNWVNEDVFHSADLARVSISLKTPTETPFLSDPVNFKWVMPNNTIWYDSSIVSGLAEKASSPAITFGSVNTTAGVWRVVYHWSNGTEVAYDYETFTLHHNAILESVYSTSLETILGQPVSVFLRFLDAENGLYILNDGATVLGNWSSGDVAFTADIVKNWWQADFDTTQFAPGEYTISIVSAAPYFETSPLLITIVIQSLTNLNPPTGPLTPLIYGRQYSYDYFYSMAHNGTGIDGATVNVTEDGSEWASIENTGNGHYNLSLTPMGIGDYSIRITFSKVGYETESHVMSFLVDPVPIEVESISSLVGLELTHLEVEVHIIESDTGNPVTDANVTLGVYRPGAVIYFYSEMEEVGPGIYSVTLTMPRSDTGTYSVRISVEKANHEMIQSFSAALVPTFDSNARIMQTLLTYSGEIGLGVILIAGVVAGQRVRSRKIRKRHAEAASIKNKINDANSILGFLVLHKQSGLPIYSRVFKGGFEETILSAFISAIMHFRTEFETSETSNEYAIIPISEVIRVVPTEHLICAFITVTSPSVEQEAKMKSYARAIGMMFDDALSQVNVQAIDEKISKTFEMMFDEFMDGFLLRRYQKGAKKFPKRLRFIEKAIPLEERNGTFSLVRLIRLLASSGVSEDELYIGMDRAICEEFIIPA
jgi:hypothetical protein